MAPMKKAPNWSEEENDLLLEMVDEKNQRNARREIYSWGDVAREMNQRIQGNRIYTGSILEARYRKMMGQKGRKKTGAGVASGGNGEGGNENGYGMGMGMGMGDNGDDGNDMERRMGIGMDMGMGNPMPGNMAAMQAPLDDFHPATPALNYQSPYQQYQAGHLPTPYAAHPNQIFAPARPLFNRDGSPEYPQDYQYNDQGSLSFGQQQDPGAGAQFHGAGAELRNGHDDNVGLGLGAATPPTAHNQEQEPGNGNGNEDGEGLFDDMDSVINRRLDAEFWEGFEEWNEDTVDQE